MLFVCLFLVQLHPAPVTPSSPSGQQALSWGCLSPAMCPGDCGNAAAANAAQFSSLFRKGRPGSSCRPEGDLQGKVLLFQWIHYMRRLEPGPATLHWNTLAEQRPSSSGNVCSSTTCRSNLLDSDAKWQFQTLGMVKCEVITCLGSLFSWGLRFLLHHPFQMTLLRLEPSLVSPLTFSMGKRRRRPMMLLNKS